MSEKRFIRVGKYIIAVDAIESAKLEFPGETVRDIKDVKLIIRLKSGDQCKSEGESVVDIWGWLSANAEDIPPEDQTED
jgi:hypothetical protein